MEAKIVEVKLETHTCYAAFWNLYGKFYCVVPTGYLSPNGPQITAHYYDSTEELNKDLRGYIAMHFNK